MNQPVNKGTSPTTAVIAIILVTVALMAALAATLGVLKEPANELSTVIAYTKAGNVLIVRHVGGDPIENAFLLEDEAIEWVNFEVRINRVKVVVREGGVVEKGGVPLMDVGLVNFEIGDRLWIPVGQELRKEDRIDFVYRPADQLLESWEFRPR